MGKGERKEGGMKALLPAVYPQVGPRESLAHSVDYADPQVGPFPMAERAHNPANANDAIAVPLGCCARSWNIS